MLDQQEPLELFAAAVARSPWLAMDTEADSLHCYPEKLCLMQFALPDHVDLVDTLAGLDMTPLLKAMSDREIILHGADYDLRLLKRTYGFVPGIIFDTMTAARLAGLEQFGFSNVVEKLLGVKLEKGPQKSDWTRRPLTDRMEEYAKNDAFYLFPLAEQLRKLLVEKGRLAWHAELCARLITDSVAAEGRTDPDNWRLAGSGRLSSRELAILRALWHWRDAEAVRANRPPFFVVSHDTLLEISCAAGAGEPIEDRIPLRMHPRRKDGIRQTVKAALKIAETDWPLPVKSFGRRPTESELVRFDKLRSHRDKVATELAIDPTLIAPKGILMGLSQNAEETLPTMMRWQRELMGYPA